MKRVVWKIILFVLTTTVYARPQTSGQSHTKLYEYKLGENDNYPFIAKTFDGAQYKAKEELRNTGTENAEVVVIGSKPHISSNGLIYTVEYIAGGNDFHPIEGHILGLHEKRLLIPHKRKQKNLLLDLKEGKSSRIVPEVSIPSAIPAYSKIPSYVEKLKPIALPDEKEKHQYLIMVDRTPVPHPSPSVTWTQRQKRYALHPCTSCHIPRGTDIRA